MHDLAALDIHDDGGGSLAQISAISVVETEPVVCACFGVGEACVRDAVASGTATTSRRSARRPAPAPIAAPACRS